LYSSVLSCAAAIKFNTNMLSILAVPPERFSLWL
jgi:hypothetical protein